MAGEQHTIGHDHVVPYVAIVGDMTASHEQAVIAYGGDPVIVFVARHGASANGDSFADHVIVADGSPSDEAIAVFEILRQDSNLGTPVYTVIFPDGGAPFDDAMRAYDGAFPNGDMLSNESIGLYLDTVGDFSVRVNDSGRVYLHTVIGPR
jgi:hypothetical protein